MPEGVPEDERWTYVLNLVLVKEGLRPGTLMEYGRQLASDERFMDILRSDPNLVAAMLSTESTYPELWVYNRDYAPLFRDEDISGLPEVDIHNIRGLRLGYPCSGEFFVHASDTGASMLHVRMYVGGAQLLGYGCPISPAHACDAAKRWLQFSQWADTLGLMLNLDMRIGPL